MEDKMTTIGVVSVTADVDIERRFYLEGLRSIFYYEDFQSENKIRRSYYSIDLKFYIKIEFVLHVTSYRFVIVIVQFWNKVRCPLRSQVTEHYLWMTGCCLSLAKAYAESRGHGTMYVFSLPKSYYFFKRLILYVERLINLFKLIF